MPQQRILPADQISVDGLRHGLVFRRAAVAQRPELVPRGQLAVVQGDGNRQDRDAQAGGFAGARGEAVGLVAWLDHEEPVVQKVPGQDVGDADDARVRRAHHRRHGAARGDDRDKLRKASLVHHVAQQDAEGGVGGRLDVDVAQGRGNHDAHQHPGQGRDVPDEVHRDVGVPQRGVGLGGEGPLHPVGIEEKGEEQDVEGQHVPRGVVQVRGLVVHGGGGTVGRPTRGRVQIELPSRNIRLCVF